MITENMVRSKKVSLRKCLKNFLDEKLKKTYKDWLDTTVLFPNLPICKGYKGTTFALLKRKDLSLTEFFNA